MRNPLPKSLRDEFAMVAMQCLPQAFLDWADAARDAYAAADAMMVERERRREGYG